MLYYHLKKINSKNEEVTMNIAENFVTNFVLFQMVWFLKQEKKNIRKYILAYLLFWVVTSADYYSSMKYEQTKLYVISFFFPQHFNSLIQMSKSQNKFPTFYVIFPLEKQCFKIKEVTRDISDIYVSTFFNFSNVLVPETNKKLQQIVYFSILNILCCYFRRSFLINEG